MIQLILLLILLLLVFYGLREFRRASDQELGRKLRQGILLAGFGLLIALLAMGRLGWLAALVGASIAALMRLLPLLMQLAPLFQRYRRARENQGGSAPSVQGMDREEALKILGLEPAATEREIIDAHRRLMQKIHPDRGGSAYLAAQLNKARDTLLTR